MVRSYALLSLYHTLRNEWAVSSESAGNGLWEEFLVYSLCQKKRTFKSEFFRGPPAGGGPKFHMVDYVTPIYIIDHLNFWPPWGPRKNSELNVHFFWHRLYTGLMLSQQRSSHQNLDLSLQIILPCINVCTELPAENRFRLDMIELSHALLSLSIPWQTFISWSEIMKSDSLFRCQHVMDWLTDDIERHWNQSWSFYFKTIPCINEILN